MQPGQASADPGDCVLLATADWNARYWTNKQHTARALAAQGWRVLFVETVGLRPPHVRSGRDWRRVARRLLVGLRDLVLGPRKVAPSIWVLSPLVLPKREYRVVGAINRFLLAYPIRRFAKKLRFAKPIVWTYHPFMMSIPELIDSGPVVYHCVDEIAAMPNVDAASFSLAETELLRRADVVFATSLPLLAKCVATNPNSYFFSNVADVDHFGRAFDDRSIPDELAGMPRPRLGYHGVLSDFKVDFDLLLKVARRRSDWHIIFLGEEREGQTDSRIAALKQLPNVHFLGYRPYADLPDYLRGIDVGLLPIVANEYTRAMFPMKLYEFLAAGVPVVSSPGTFTAGEIPHVRVAGDPASFIAAIEVQLGAPRMTAAEARQAVGANTWDERMTRMLRIVRVAPPKRRPGP